MRGAASIEQIRVDDEVPVLRRTVEAETLVRYAGAADDYVYLHWNKPRVLEEGFPDVVVHGWLTCAYMCEAVSDWIPREVADIASYSVRYLRPTFPGEVTCSGRVTNIETGGDERRVIDLELWARGGDGELTTTGKMRLRSVDRAARDKESG